MTASTTSFAASPSHRATPFTREVQWQRLQHHALNREPVDVLVIGGGATGLGVAVDAAARGFSVTLVEAEDFAKGTSSRSTKLVHGGVRYLAQGNVALVREALHERASLLRNAPHLAQPLRFVVPGYRRWEPWFYGLGLKLYDALAGKRGLGPTQWLDASATLQALPGVRRQGLVGGVAYWDGQFDDARLALALAQTAVQHGAVVVNHARVTGLLHASRGADDASGNTRALSEKSLGELPKVSSAHRVVGATVHDDLNGSSLQVMARCIVNATGVWVDEVMAMDRVDASASKPLPSAPPSPPPHERLVAPSQGIHLVVDRSFMPSDQALMVPKTSDGRVLFAVPWLGKLILGTTDAPREDMPLEPRPMDEEIDFVLHEASRYLAKAPTRQDIRSAWAGLRPLVKPPSNAATKSISREHTVLASPSGVVTVTGGKWTTYRAMAEDVLEACMAAGHLPRRASGRTSEMSLVETTGTTSSTDAGDVSSHQLHSLAHAPGLHAYGAAATCVANLEGHDRWLWRLDGGGLTEAMVRHAVQHEMACTVEDVLARRSRLLFLDAQAAARVAHDVVPLLTHPAHARLSAFLALAKQYALMEDSDRATHIDPSPVNTLRRNA